MTKMVLFKFRPRDGKLEQLITFFEGALPGTRQFPGNRGVIAARQTWEEYQLVITTFWLREDDMEQYIKWRKEQGDYATLRTLLQGKPMIQTYDVLDIVEPQIFVDRPETLKKTAPSGMVNKFEFKNYHQ